MKESHKALFSLLLVTIHDQIKYVRLEKGQYVKLQPKTGALSQVPELKHTLEMNMSQHATLTKGDFLQVWYRGKPHDLKVKGGGEGGRGGKDRVADGEVEELLGRGRVR